MNQSVKGQSKGTVLVKSLFVSYIVTAVILLILALIVYKAEPSNMVISVGVVFTYLLSSFIGGMLTGKKIQEKRFLWGIVSGALYFAIIFAVSLLMNKDIVSQIGNTIIVFVTCGFGGMLGGMLS